MSVKAASELMEDDSAFVKWLKGLKASDEVMADGPPITLKEVRERIEALEATDESAVDALLWRIEALEEWRRLVDHKLAVCQPGAAEREQQLIGTEGLERSYTKVIKDKLDSDDARDAADVVRHFFRQLTHDERVRILLSAGMITVYIANDPVYYSEALDVMKKAHRDEIAALYGFMYRPWTEYEAMAVSGGVVTCKCGETVTVKVQILDKHHPNVKEVEGNAELICPKCGSRLCVWDGYVWVAYLPGWTVKLDGLVKRKDFVVEIEHVCELCERSTRTKQRWSGQWLCDWCNASEVKARATDFPSKAAGRPKEEDVDDGYGRIRDYVMQRFGDEQRPDQTVSEFVIDVLAAVATGKE